VTCSTGTTPAKSETKKLFVKQRCQTTIIWSGLWGKSQQQFLCDSWDDERPKKKDCFGRLEKIAHIVNLRNHVKKYVVRRFRKKIAAHANRGIRALI